MQESLNILEIYKKEKFVKMFYGEENILHKAAWEHGKRFCKMEIYFLSCSPAFAKKCSSLKPGSIVSFKHEKSGAIFHSIPDELLDSKISGHLSSTLKAKIEGKIGYQNIGWINKSVLPKNPKFIYLFSYALYSYYVDRGLQERFAVDERDVLLETETMKVLGCSEHDLTNFIIDG